MIKHSFCISIFRERLGFVSFGPLSPPGGVRTFRPVTASVTKKFCGLLFFGLGSVRAQRALTESNPRGHGHYTIKMGSPKHLPSSPVEDGSPKDLSSSPTKVF